MKAIFKNCLSLVLALTIVFGSLIAGLSGIDSDNLFAVKTKAGYTGLCGENLVWEFDGKDTLTVSGTGYMDDYGPADVDEITVTPWSGVSYEIKNLVITDGVKSIGSSAFERFINLSSITISDSVTSIGKNAFYNTPYYKDEANWENDVLYIGNHLIKAKETLADSYAIKDGTLTIADASFQNCTNLLSITIPDSVKGVGDWAFYCCLSLTSIKIPDSVKRIGDYAFDDCIELVSATIGKSVKSIGDYAFNNCEKLVSISLPDSVTSIGENAFTYCGYSYNSENWKNNVLYLGNHVINANNIEKIEIKKGTKNIACGAFSVCNSLTSIVIPDSVISINAGAFAECRKLKYVFYGGQKTKWSKVNVDENNLNLTKAKMHYGAVDHTPSDWVIDKNATVNATGSHHKECTVCGATIKTAVIPQLKPATPKLTAIANTASGVKVTWGKVSGADSYIVYRRAYNATTKKWGSWTRIADDVTATSYVDKTAKSGTYYLYTVKAVNEAGNSGYNTSGIKTYFLAVPKSVTTSNTTNTITVKWGKVAGATGYIVYRKTGDGKWTNLGKTTGTSFADKTAKAGVTYKYTIKAYYGSYVSAYNTNGYAVRRLTIPTLKSAVSSKTGITFTWNKVTGATGYIVYRKTGSGNWQRLGTVKTNTYLDKTAKKGVTYKYTVKAYYGTSTSYYNSKGLTIKDKY